MRLESHVVCVSCACECERHAEWVDRVFTFVAIVACVRCHNNNNDFQRHRASHRRWNGNKMQRKHTYANVRRSHTQRWTQWPETEINRLKMEIDCLQNKFSWMRADRASFSLPSLVRRSILPCRRPEPFICRYSNMNMNTVASIDRCAFTFSHLQMVLRAVHERMRLGERVNPRTDCAKWPNQCETLWTKEKSQQLKTKYFFTKRTKKLMFVHSVAHTRNSHSMVRFWITFYGRALSAFFTISCEFIYDLYE